MSTQQEKKSHKREVVVVLGVGRSGTSLAMQALETLGVRTSENMIPPNVSNPKGFYEDADIVEIHKHLLSTLAPSPAMPLQEGWMNTPDAKQALKQLKEIVEANVSAGDAPWAFKDPRTATFLPLWIRLFNQLKIVPRFILAVRRPEAVIESFAQQYGDNQNYAELVYLLRMLDALYYTGRDCQFLVYEDWVRDEQLVLSRLYEHVFGLDQCESNSGHPFQANLNRVNFNLVSINNPLLVDLQQAIELSASNENNRDQLMHCVLRSLEIVKSFSPWVRSFSMERASKEKCQNTISTMNMRVARYESERQIFTRYGEAIKEMKCVVKELDFLRNL